MSKDKNEGKSRSLGLRADVDHVPDNIGEVLNKLVEYGQISEEERKRFNTYPLNKYDDGTGLRSRWDDKFILAIISFLLGYLSRFRYQCLASICCSFFGYDQLVVNYLHFMPQLLQK